MPVIRFGGMYSVELCRAYPELIFVFGDNMRGVGKGGQAIIRDEPNAFGVATKHTPSMDRSAFFRDGDSVGLNGVLKALEGLREMLEEGKRVVIPETEDGDVSLGLGLARLNELAPTIYAIIAGRVAALGAAYGEVYVTNSRKLDSAI